MNDKFRNLQEWKEHAVMAALVSVLGRRLDESKVCEMQGCNSFVIIATARMPDLPLYDLHHRSLSWTARIYNMVVLVDKLTPQH
jgi:hypothetical protein